MAVAPSKSEEIAKLMNFSGADRAKINSLLEEYLMEDGDTSDNSTDSDDDHMDNHADSDSSDESSETILAESMENGDDDFENAMKRLTTSGEVVTDDSTIEYQKALDFRYC